MSAAPSGAIPLAPALRAAFIADLEAVVDEVVTRRGLDDVDRAALRHMAVTRVDTFWANCLANLTAIQAADTDEAAAAIVTQVNEVLWTGLDGEVEFYLQRIARSAPGDRP